MAKGASFSGHERNRVFLQRRVDGRVDYVDVSAVSGLDSLGDGRAFAWLDFDHDGLRDVVVTNANEPRVQLFRNQMRAPHAVMALRLVGDHRGGKPSNADAIGARVEVDLAGRTRVMELRAGEGLAAQNSAELLIGLGAATSVDAIRVVWPGGGRTVLKQPKVVSGGRATLVVHEAAPER